MKTATQTVPVVGGYTVSVECIERGPVCRRVFFHLPFVCGDVGGLHYELTSYKGGAVEVYVRNSDGIYMWRGSIAQHMPGGCETFRAVWYAAQPSKAARTAFEASAVRS